MNDKLEETVNQILQNAIAAASEGTEFLKGQLPDVVNQLLVYHRFSDLFAISMWTLIVYAIWVVYKKHRETIVGQNGDNFFLEVIFPMIGVIMPIICIVGFFLAVDDLVKILVAPKVWLLEYAAHLVHK